MNSRALSGLLSIIGGIFTFVFVVMSIIKDPIFFIYWKLTLVSFVATAAIYIFYTIVLHKEIDQIATIIACLGIALCVIFLLIGTVECSIFGIYRKISWIGYIILLISICVEVFGDDS